jgi:uncharacterized repeat protein (TIGR03843 family)
VPEGCLPVANARDEIGDAYALAHADDPRLARLAVLDAVLNNADRKGGHVLYAPGGHLYGVDHGVCFHVDNKLRTVLWGWTGKPIPPESLQTLAALEAALSSALGETLCEHLTATEVRQVGLRARRLIRAGRYPRPPQDWPAVPWPPI